MQVAVTGAAGFTGRYVTDALAARGVSWHALDADLTDPAALDRAVAARPFDRLIHLAAIAFVAAAEWQPFYTVNQLGTFALLEAVARHHQGARCILAGSAQVYGPGAGGRIDEGRVPAPANHYAVSKYAMELGAQAWRDRLELVVTRPFNYTGVGQEERYLIPKLVAHFRERAATIELGNIEVRRDFGDVRAVADAYVGLALAETAPATLNICTGEARSVAAVVATLEELTGHRIEVRVNPAFVRADDVPLLVGDTGRLRAALPGWAPRPFADTLAWMLAAPAAPAA